MEARVSGVGRQEYLWSTVIISILLHAIVYLLRKDHTEKPTIQELENDEGYVAFIQSVDVIVSVRTMPKDARFVVIVHTDSDFSTQAISNLAIGYFNATNVNVTSDDVVDYPTRKMYIKVDSSAQWRLIEPMYNDDNVTVTVPDEK